MEVTDSKASFRDRKLLSRRAQKALRSMHGTRKREREAELRFTNFTAFQNVVKSKRQTKTPFF